MTGNITPHDQAPDDDGFGGPFSRSARGAFLRWDADQGWRDRDGLAPPSPLLAFAVDEILQRWTDKKPETISDKPLPDPDELNAAIPVSEWEIGLDKKPRSPWAHVARVRLVHPGTGEIFIYGSPTVGGHIAVDALKEAVVVMRALRGQRVTPVVELGERPMKTNFGLKTRPHFQIIDWKTPSGRTTLLAEPALPQLLASEPAAPEPASQAQSPAPPPAPPPAKARAKPPVNLAADTLAAMGGVKPETTADLNDEIPL